MAMLRCDVCDVPVLLLTDQQLHLVQIAPERYVYVCLSCTGERDA